MLNGDKTEKKTIEFNLERSEDEIAEDDIEIDIEREEKVEKEDEQIEEHWVQNAFEVS